MSVWEPTEAQIEDVHAKVVAEHYTVMGRIQIDPPSTLAGRVRNERRCHCGHSLPWVGHELVMERHRLRVALLAVGPDIAEKAWDEAYQAGALDTLRSPREATENPYREEARRG